jgi:hypothetical protein
LNIDDTFFFTSLLSNTNISTWFLPCSSFEATHHWLHHTHTPHHPGHPFSQHGSVTNLCSHSPHTTCNKYWEPCYSPFRPLVKGSKAGPSNPSAATSCPNLLFSTSSPIRPTVNGRPGACLRSPDARTKAKTSVH